MNNRVVNGKSLPIVIAPIIGPMWKAHKAEFYPESKPQPPDKVMAEVKLTFYAATANALRVGAFGWANGTATFRRDAIEKADAETKVVYREWFKLRYGGERHEAKPEGRGHE